MNSKDTYLLTTSQFYTILYVDLKWIHFNECIPFSLSPLSPQETPIVSSHLCVSFSSLATKDSPFIFIILSLSLCFLFLSQESPHIISVCPWFSVRGCQSVSSVCLSFSSLSLRIFPNLSQSVCVAMSVCFCLPLCMSVSLSRFLNK